MITILIAPDKFKSTLSANEFCKAVEKGLSHLATGFSIISLPLSDGGEGFLEVMAKTGNYILMNAQVKDPLGRQIRTEYLSSHDGKRAVIETARVIGLQLFSKQEYNCLIMNTYGLGQLIYQIYKQGAEEIDIGIGGTATTDAGAGMAYALGFKFLDKNNRVILPSGINLRQVRRIIPPVKAEKMLLKIKGLCDVSNPMYGENGAALVFARQKGADDEGVRILDEGLQNMAFLMVKELG
ncbi:MAG TPA: glycerate kinase, partial [Saprospirales bacterium]|nr:glycerate kinase [Saprospirales bacterium]